MYEDILWMTSKEQNIRSRIFENRCFEKMTVDVKGPLNAATSKMIRSAPTSMPQRAGREGSGRSGEREGNLTTNL